MVTTTRNIKHRGPAQVRPVDKDVILLRKVNWKKMRPGIIDKIANTSLRPGEKEMTFPWFSDGYVAGEQPRDALVSRAIMEATEGFAIARTDSGEILAEFKKDQVVEAEAVTHGAKTQLAIDVTLNGEDDDEGEDDEAE